MCRYAPPVPRPLAGVLRLHPFSQGRKYSRRDYTVVFLIVTGLATFMNAETRASEDSETPFSVLGVICISMALVIDAAIINIQVRIHRPFCFFAVECFDEKGQVIGFIKCSFVCLRDGLFVVGFVILQGTAGWVTWGLSCAGLEFLSHLITPCQICTHHIIWFERAAKIPKRATWCGCC